MPPLLFSQVKERMRAPESTARTLQKPKHCTYMKFFGMLFWIMKRKYNQIAFLGCTELISCLVSKTNPISSQKFQFFIMSPWEEAHCILRLFCRTTLPACIQCFTQFYWYCYIRDITILDFNFTIPLCDNNATKKSFCFI